MPQENQRNKSISRLPPKLWQLHTSALIETLVFLIIATALNIFLGKGNRYLDICPHPFWIIVLLINVRYGTWDGLLTTLFCTVFLYFGNLPPQTNNETIFEYQYRLAITPVLWLIASLVLGGIRSALDKDYEDTKRELQTTRKQLDTITKSYQNLKNIKENLETRVASQLKTAASAYTSFKTLESLNPALILLNLSSIVLPILNPKKFSIWSNGEYGFEPATSHGWEENDTFARRFPIQHPLYQQMMKEKHVISTIHASDEQVLGKEGILAAPLIDPETGEIFGMLKIEDIDFVDLNIGNLWAFKNVCESIGYAYANARRFNKMEGNTIYSRNPLLLSPPLYIFLETYLKQLASKAGFPLTLLALKPAGDIEAELENRLLSSFKKKLPDTALLFKHIGPPGSIDILLPNKNSQEAQTLMQSLLQEKEFTYINIEITIKEILSSPRQNEK